MPLDNLPMMGDDAFKDGFLSKKFGNGVIERANLFIYGEVSLPPGAGDGKIIYSRDNWMIDLTGLRFLTSESTTYPFKLVRVSDTSFKVLAGSAAGFSIAEATYTSVTTTKYVWIEVTQGYGTGTGIWTASNAVLGTPAGSYGSANSTRQIIQLGIVTCAGSVITTISQVTGGNQWVARTGNGSTYVDANGSISPLVP